MKRVNELESALYENKKMEQKETLIEDIDYEYNHKEPLLSIVIPVYNVEKFIGKCLDSLLEQTYKNIEIICVDDASPSKESSIIKEYRKKDGRIKIIRHKKNEGLFQARITGMKYASGEYFAFLDSDDHVSIDYYRMLMKKIIEEDADIVIGDFVDEYEDGRIEYYNYDNTRFQNITLLGDEVYDIFMKQHGLWFGWHTVWNKVYRKNIWEESLPSIAEFANRHGHLIMTEDIAYSCTFLYFAKKVVNAHDSYYYYFHHSGQSVANANLNKFTKNIHDVASVFEYFKEFLVRNNVFCKYEKDYNAFLDVYIEFWTGNAKALPQEDVKNALKVVKDIWGTSRETNYKNHYHYSLRTSIATFEWYENIKKAICSPETELVSFDIFDTLVLRPFFEPSDLFALMNQKFNEMVGGMTFIDFQKVRINVEAELRHSLSVAEEVTLLDIYTSIASSFDLIEEQKNELMQYEIDLELKYAQPRKCGKELFELARYMDKKVVVISDIYLPHYVVEKILKKCGYEPDSMYISSDYLVMKNTGNLYNVMLEKEKVVESRIVHIGDNWDSDVKMAQTKRLITHHLPSPITMFKGENMGIYSGSSFCKIFKSNGKQYMGENAAEFLGIRCMLAIIANKFFDNPYTSPYSPETDFNSNPYFIGYYALGMHLYAVVDWIRDIALKEKRRKVQFVSRDGYLPMKAMEILNNLRDDYVDYTYMHISRKASALFQTTGIADIQSYFSSFGSFNINVKTPIDTFSLLAREDMKGNSISLVKHNMVYYGKTNGFNESMKLGKNIFNNYLDKEKVEAFIKDSRLFFSTQIAENDIIFDLGYRANKEYILTALIGRPVDCLYIYSNESKAIERSIANNFSLRTFYDYTPSAYAAAREYMFSELSPSCIGYDSDNNMSPIFDPNFSEHYFNQFVITAMQKGALEFISEFESTFEGTIVNKLYRKFDASLPFEHFMNYSTYFDRHVLGCVTFEDDTYAGGTSKLVDVWDAAVKYHKLDSECGESIKIQTQIRVIEKEHDPIYIQPENYEINSRTKLIYEDGLLIKAFEWLGRKYPIGSKKRERLKKIVKIFVR